MGSSGLAVLVRSRERAGDSGTVLALAGFTRTVTDPRAGRDGSPEMFTTFETPLDAIAELVGR